MNRYSIAELPIVIPKIIDKNYHIEIIQQDLQDQSICRSIEPHHEKTSFLLMRKKKEISCAETTQLISAFVFAKQIVQSLYFLNPSVAAQPGLCRTWSEIPKTGFLTTRLYTIFQIQHIQFHANISHNQACLYELSNPQ